jgi:putative hemolysin
VAARHVGAGDLQPLGQKPEAESAVTDEEIRTVMARGAERGVIEPEEQRMLVGVMRLADRPARGLLTPRADLDWIDLADEEAAARAVLLSTPHSRLPVVEGGPDKVVGVVQVRAVLTDLLEGKPLDVRAHVRPAPIVPDTINALDVLDALRRSDVPMAIVFDEFGHFEGVITPADALLAIAGEFRGDTDGEGGDEPAAVRREDGSWLLSGWMPADEMADTIGLALPPEPRDYQTVAGFVLSRLRRIPATGECVEALGFRFEVVDIDGPAHRQGRGDPDRGRRGAARRGHGRRLGWPSSRPCR